jgi:hypothetical protein
MTLVENSRTFLYVYICERNAKLKMKTQEMFSYRKNIKKFKDIIHVDTIPDFARNHIWDILYKFIFKQIKDPGSNMYNLGSKHFLIENQKYSTLLEKIWTRIYNRSLDTIPNEYETYFNIVRNYFYGARWNDVYDFIEFVLYYYNNKELIQELNEVFMEDNLGYRIIDKRVTDIINPPEIDSINESLNSSYETVQLHFHSAIDLLYGDKPDYRNSIKESISAVEAIANIKMNVKNEALSKLLKKMPLHNALKDGLAKIYAYTSDGDGIRHALMSEETLTHTDAKYLLVVCSGFVNYINEKV